MTCRPFDLRACLVYVAGEAGYDTTTLTARDMPAVAMAMVLDTAPDRPAGGNDNDA